MSSLTFTDGITLPGWLPGSHWRFEFYHPLVHWLARRLQLQQELAADAVGARFAGGSGTVPAHPVAAGPEAGRTVSVLAGEGVPPGRGTLIRRIAMLQNESIGVDKLWPRSRRLMAVVCLLSVTLGVVTLRGPALGVENQTSPDVAGAGGKTSASSGKPVHTVRLALRLG